MKNFYITNNHDLGVAIQMIRDSKLVAIDTEFTREKTYYPILSLIQLAVRNSNETKSFIVDCLSSVDLAPLLQIIADDKITKILHSSLQDLQIFHQKNNMQPAAIMDTQIMANFCGFGYNVSYSNLVENFCKINLDKTQQRSDWQQRPLSQMQIEYALIDVLYLEEVNHKLSEILHLNKRHDWYFEEVKSFIDKSLNQSVGQIEENLFKNFSFNKRVAKSAKQISQIKKFLLWRENCAKKIDIPRQHFLKDEMIDKMVSSGNYDYDFDLRGVDVGEVEEILSCQKEDFAKEKNFFMNNKQKNLFDEAKNLIAKIAKEENLQEQFLITTMVLKSIICNHHDFDKLVYGWRYQVFGEKLKKLIS